MSIRHKARVAATQVLCALLWRNQVLTDDVEAMIATIKSESFPQTREDDFFRGLIFGVIKNRSAIDPIIQEYAPKFRIANLSAVDRSILEVGMYELMHTDTPTAIVINEAVEIAKEFGDEGAPKFVNGVLSAYTRSKKEEGSKKPSA